jgi:hypothetical protein
MKAVQEQMDADQEERKAERKAYQEQMLAKMEDIMNS